MAFQTISLPDKLPRDAQQLKKKLPLHRGLIAYFISGVAALFVPFLPFIYFAVNGQIGQIGWTAMVLTFLLFEISAIYLINFANSNFLRRLRAFSRGYKIEAKIVSIDSFFDFFSLSKSKIIHVELKMGKEIKKHKIKLSVAPQEGQFKVNDKIGGLIDLSSDSICFPVEIGLMMESYENLKFVNPRT
jgi:hypothetical protein